MPRVGSHTRRRRRESGGNWAPSNASGLYAWFDFSDSSTLFQNAARTTPVTADAQFIMGVLDKSGNGRHLSDTAGPVFKLNQQNGNSVGDAPAGGKRLSSDATWGLSQPLTAFVAGKYSAGGGNERFFDGSVRVLIGQQLGATAIAYAGIENAALKPSFAGNVWRVFACTFNGVSTKFWVGGGTPSTGDPGSNGLTGTAYLFSNNLAETLIGQVGEMLFYSGSMSLADVNNVGQYLANKWGVTWTTAT